MLVLMSACSFEHEVEWYRERNLFRLYNRRVVGTFSLRESIEPCVSDQIVCWEFAHKQTYLIPET